MSGLPDGLDVLSLRSTEQGISVRIGGVDVGPALRNANVQTRLNDLPTASIQLDSILLAGEPVDYFGVIEVGGRLPAGDMHSLFTGNVMTASVTDDELELDCQTHPSLTERKVGGIEFLNAHPGEMLHMITRSGGLSEEQIHVAGLEQELPIEVIEVLLPLTGVAVSEPVRIGPVTLLQAAETEPLWHGFADNMLQRELRESECHALYRRVGRQLLDVEEQALATIDVVLAWLVARARYGLAYLPDGAPQEFIRSRALSRPTPAGVVLVKGLESGRAWLRRSQPAANSRTLSLSEDDSQWLPPDPEALSTSQRLALLALRRAAAASAVLPRVGALWEAIEFYVAGVRPEPRFSAAEAKRIRKSIPKDVDLELRDRAMNLLAKLNDPPLMVKIREAAERDGVPLTDAEIELLKQVRIVRNNTAHGRHAELPAPADVDYAVSMVARLLLHSIARR
jgi:hypothetical protein